MQEFSIFKTDPNSILRNHAGVFRDEDRLGTEIPIKSGTAIDDAVFASAEKPIQYELLGNGLHKGLHKYLKSTYSQQLNKAVKQRQYTWDNIHWWGASRIRSTNNVHISTPGAFNAVHIHWRWGDVVQDPYWVEKIFVPGKPGLEQFSGQSRGGVLTDPNVQNQTIKFAIFKHNGDEDKYWEHSTEVFEDFFKDDFRVDAGTIGTDINEGANLVLYYSADVFANQRLAATGKALKGSVLIHGIFFAHEPEREASLKIGSHGKLYLNPNKPERTFERNPTA